MSEPRIFTEQEVRAAVPKARELAAKRQGKPHVYSEQDLVNALWSYLSGYVTDEDKAQMISSDNIKWALDYLDSFGHTEENFNNVVNQLYNTPSNNRRKEASDRNAKNNSERRNTGGYNGLGKNLLTFGFGLLDTPRRAVASVVQNLSGNEDPRYSTGRVLDVMDTTPTPITGVKFAQEHPFVSGLVDILAPATVFTSVNRGVNLVKNAANYATRQHVTGAAKTKALQQINSGTVPTGQEYEVVRTVIPTKNTTSANYYTEYTRPGGKKLTGTASGATGRPYAKGSRVNGFQVHGFQTVVPTTKAVDNVYGWTSVPYTPFPWLGLPQFVPSTAPEQSKMELPAVYKIEESIPMTYDDSDIINALGAKPGDILEMPDGRRLKYETGGTDSRGTQHRYTLNKEYDHHDTDVKQQPNVPSKTTINEGGSDGYSVKVVPGKTSTTVARDSTKYFPYLIARRTGGKLIPKCQNPAGPLIPNEDVIKKSQEMLQYLSQHSDEQKAKKEFEEKAKQEKRNKIITSLGENTTMARDARTGNLGAQLVRQLYAQGKNEEAQNLAKKLAKGELTGLSMIGGTISSNLIGDLLTTGTVTSAEAVLDGTTENLFKDLTKYGSVDLLSNLLFSINNPITKTIRKNLVNKLKNTYYNKAPWTYKPNRDWYYRVGDKTLLNDVKESGVIRTNGVDFPEYETYFAKGVPLDGRYNRSGGNYGSFMIEVSDETPFIGKSMGTITQQGLKKDLSNIDQNFNLTHNITQYVVPKQSVTHKTPLKFDKTSMFLYKPHWFLGYKRVNYKQGGRLIPKHNKGNKVAETFGVDVSMFTKNPNNNKQDNKDVAKPNKVRNKLTKKKHASYLNPQFVNTRPTPGFITRKDKKDDSIYKNS